MMTAEGPNTFTPVEDYVLSWNSKTVLNLALTIWQDGRWNVIPILGDALEDAGCHDTALLEACRQHHESNTPGAHILEAILGTKEQTATQLYGLPGIDWLKAARLLGMEEEYHLQIPTLNLQHAPSDHWVIPMMKGKKNGRKLTCNTVITALRKANCKVWTPADSDDLDGVITRNDRDPNRDGSYAVMTPRSAEPDPATANLSANDLAAQKYPGMTLQERLWLELGYYLTAGNHLDRQYITRCNCSRSSVGNVPVVLWSRVIRRVDVRWFGPDYRYGRLRSRPAVSLPA